MSRSISFVTTGALQVTRILTLYAYQGIAMKTIIVCWIWVISMRTGSSKVHNQQPHIVLIVADDLGWNDVGFHGSEIRTPNIDKLAGEGVTLDRYYVQPICSPTRSQLMSGRYQIHTGLQHSVIRPAQPNGLPLTLPTLPDLLRKQGYATHMVGKWHLGFYKKEFTPTYRGFDSHFGYWTGAEDYFNHSRCYRVDGRDLCGLDYRDNMEPATSYTHQYSTHVFAHKAQAIISDHAQSQPNTPLFLYLPFQAVHSPLQVPEEYIQPYESIIHDKSRRTFAGMMSCLDEAVGNITKSLQTNGLWENTLLVFTTDNGGQVHSGGNNWPLRGNKDTLWEGGMRGVGFAHGKGVESRRGHILKELIHVSDWLPTLVTLAGGDVSNATLDGYNAWPSISQGMPSRRKELLHNIDPLSKPLGQRLATSPFDNRIRAAIRSRSWKLITGNPGEGQHFPPPSVEYLAIHSHTRPWVEYAQKNIWLFDILADPLEKKDLSARYPDVVMEMLQLLSRYNETSVECRYPAMDPASDPANHGGVWSAWMDN